MIKQQYLLIFYAVFALFISYIPLVNIPFNWLETIFHELSHALITLLTGGQVVAFQLELNGAGQVLSRGGISLLIAFSGYFGAALWGFLLYQVGYRSRVSKITLIVLIILFVVTLIFYVRDLLTVIILSVVTLLLCALIKNIRGRWLVVFVQLTGVLVLFNAIKSPLYLLDGKSRGDGALLAQITLVPEIVWVILWFGWGIFLLYKIWLLSQSKATVSISDDRVSK